MPTSYFDQFFLIDPGNPPPVGTVLTKSFLEAVDQNNNNFLNRFSNDSVDGSDITATWVGDTITVTMNGSDVTITGVTFYLADGRSVFTPTDGTNLDTATFISATYVTSQGSLPVGSLGPPCFVEGTLIATPDGERPVEALRTGDMVETVDSGAQAIRWLGHAEVAGDSKHAPVVFLPGAIGNARELRVSPQHRMLIGGWQAELHFGQAEVLVPAKHLVDGNLVVRARGGKVRYYHLLLDRHEIIFSNGVPSESFYPGDQILLNDRKTRAELLQVMPCLARPGVQGFGATARPTARSHEARMLWTAMAPRAAGPARGAMPT